MRTVCLLTAGTGTRMGRYSTIINKSLLPIDNKAIISHIIEQFPIDTDFVVALGYQGSTVKDYLNAAHYDRHFTFVEVENFDGPGSGPAHSVYCCKEYLENKTNGFTLIACDGYYSNLNKIPLDRDVVCASIINPIESPAYCNIIPHENFVSHVVDKKYCDSGLACNGVYHFFNATKFFESLYGTELSSGYAYLTPHIFKLEWVDLGTYDKYIKYYNRNFDAGSYDYSKSNEFLYFVNGRVIKFFHDKNMAANRVSRAKDRPYFPEIMYYNDHIYSYKFSSGETLYNTNNIDIFKRLLEFLDDIVWPAVKTDDKLTVKECLDFYKTKTYKRLELFEKKYPDFSPKYVNGTKIYKTMRECLDLVPWKSITETNIDNRTAYIHGDLQFDNILYDGEKFTLLDWRQDFAGKTTYGDAYYDIAKLLGGMIINYDLIKKNLFTFTENNNQVYYDYARRASYDDMIDYIRYEFLPDDYYIIIANIVTLIYLNMSPLHEPPYDKMLYSIALERFNR